MLIDGQWLGSEKYFDVVNPATGETLEQVADGSSEQAIAAVEAASRALPAWSASTAYERAGILQRAHQLMLQQKQELATLMTREQGKPLRAALAEVQYGADFLQWFAEEAKRIYGETIPSARADQRFVL